MKLYVFPPSPNARKVQLVEHHLGLGCETEMVDLSKGEQHEPDYARLNPNELMPTLVDGDFVLWESNAIMQYLCSKAKEQTLWPADSRGQADVVRWQFWELAHWAPACGTLIFENMVKAFFGDDSGPDPAKVKDGEERFHRYAKVLDGHLKGREWLVGEGLTLADVSTGVHLAFAMPARLPWEDYVDVQRWYGQLGELEAWKATQPQVGQSAAR